MHLFRDSPQDLPQAAHKADELGNNEAKLLAKEVTDQDLLLHEPARALVAQKRLLPVYYHGIAHATPPTHLEDLRQANTTFSMEYARPSHHCTDMGAASAVLVDTRGGIDASFDPSIYSQNHAHRLS